MNKILPILLLIVFSEYSYSQIVWNKILPNTDIVMLGEQAHGIRSFYEEKQNIIKEIEAVSSKELLLLVESPFVLSVIRELQNRDSDYHYHHTNTEENIQFFSEYKNFGIDLQEDCRYTEFSDFLIKRKYCDPTDKDILRMDSILSLCIIGENYIKDVLNKGDVVKLKSSILHLKSKVLSPNLDEYESRLLGLCFESRLRLADYLHLEIGKGYQKRIQFRDSVMAVNVQEIINSHRDFQAIIWAANLHIGGKGIMGKKWTKKGVKSMSEYLEQNYSLYRIAIDSKRRKNDEMYFQEFVITGLRNLVDPRYLELHCH
jgi:hypothetical protein